MPKTRQSPFNAGVANQNEALCHVAKQAFCNWSEFRLKDIANRTNQQKLKTDFLAYLDGFSPNVQEMQGDELVTNWHRLKLRMGKEPIEFEERNKEQNKDIRRQKSADRVG